MILTVDELFLFVSKDLKSVSSFQWWFSNMHMCPSPVIKQYKKDYLYYFKHKHTLVVIIISYFVAQLKHSTPPRPNFPLKSIKLLQICPRCPSPEYV